MEDRESPQRRYRIRVEGRLGSHFSAGIDGMTQSDEPSGTTLTGDFLDQSQLYGILDRLRQLGVEIQSFEVIRPEKC